MLACPGCGANLTYNIEKGKLLCSYCNTEYAPNDKGLKQKMATQEQQIDARVFTCPQCGGEMYTTDVDATAYCSYCGASNVLQSRVEGVDAPQKIIPFSVTKDECIGAINKLARKTLYAPREFRNGSGEDKLRPLYVPYRVYDMEMDGKAEIYGNASWIEGSSRIVEDRKIDCHLNAHFADMAYDASSAFDDTLAERIAPFDLGEARDFDSVYLAGSYANIPDVDAETYRQKALEHAAQKSIDALGKKSVLEQIELSEYPDGSSLADHLPVKKETTYTALLPVWFMSFRRGNRIAYAAVNGETGKVYSDIPLSLPAFWIGSLLTALPIFALLNFAVTMRPQTGVLAASFLALAGAILYAGNYISILRREEHLDDVGYRAGRNRPGGDAGSDAGGVTRSAGGDSVTQKKNGNRLVRWVTGQDDGTMPKVKRGTAYYVLKIFSVWPYILIMALLFFFVRPVFWTAVIVGSAVFCLRKTGGRIALWSGLLIAAATVGLVFRELPLVSDLWYYGCTAGILVILVIALTRLVHQHNMLSTRPIPLLFKDGKAPGGGNSSGGAYGGGNSSGNDTASESGNSSASGSQKIVPGKGGSAMSGIVLLVAGTMLLQLLLPIGALANYTYTNEETGFKAVIEDGEDLLTDDEEQQLAVKMKELTKYGNAVFLSCSQYDYSETLEYANRYYYQKYGDASGTIFVIDMGQRMIALYSAGENNELIRREEGYVITDNAYIYARSEEYYKCAELVFDQVGVLLEGGRIARPMKYINNALLALILAVLINYAVISAQESKRRAAHDAVFGNADYLPNVEGSRWSAVKAVKTFSFTGLCTIVARVILESIIEGALSGGSGSSGGGSGSHGSSGGSGGGSGRGSGSGGSHRF